MRHPPRPADLAAIRPDLLERLDDKPKKGFDRIFCREPNPRRIHATKKSIVQRVARAANDSQRGAIAAESRKINAVELPPPSSKCQGCGRIMSRIVRFCAECVREGSR